MITAIKNVFQVNMWQTSWCGIYHFLWSVKCFIAGNTGINWPMVIT